MDEENGAAEIERAEDDLYNYLDRNGADKRLTYKISALIDAKIAGRTRGKTN